MVNACEMITLWNQDVTDYNDYLCSPEGMQKMAASCMMIESIGEGIKKVEKLLPGLLARRQPTIPWRQIAGMRDHIAHGYFNIDAEIVIDVVKNEIAPLKLALLDIEKSIS